MTHRRKILGEDVYLAGIASLQSQPDDKVFARWILNFFAY